MMSELTLINKLSTSARGIAFIESLQKEMKSYEDEMNRTEHEMISAKDRIYDLMDRVSEIEDLLECMGVEV